MGGGTRPGSLGSHAPTSATVRGTGIGAPPGTRANSPRSLGLDAPPAADAGISPASPLSGDTVQADSGVAGTLAGGEISCGMDQVIVLLTAGAVPTPNTSHSVCSLRATPGANDPDMLAYTKFSLNVNAVVPQGVTKPIRLPFTLTFPYMYIASELRPITGAVSRMETHERQHPREWEAVIRAELPAFCERIDAKVTSVASTPAQRSALVGILRALTGTVMDEWNELLIKSTHDFDGADYPSLHADLATLGVPLFKCVHGVARRE